MESDTMENEKLRTYDEVNAEMQRLQDELNNVRNESLRKKLEPWVGKVFKAETGVGITYYEYIQGFNEEDLLYFVEAVLYPDGSFKLYKYPGSTFYEVEAILDLYEVVEVPVEDFKKILKREVEAV